MGCDDSHHRSQSPELLQLVSSSSSSSESSFREIEDAFLQTQTRIWLGEVLQIRLDEQLTISDVLADGELLFQVSKVVWILLLAKHVELRHIIAYQHQPFAPKENIGKYRPYSNVDSFLKICKILGLTGIDLFSPSDVVEKRNTRKVCMCIRSFSKKARSKNINVPDFDIVSYTITMPKDMVGCIRRNLELSQSSLAASPPYYLQKHAGGRYRQSYSVTASPRDQETYLEESDDTEINHPELQSDGLCTDFLCDYTSQINSSVEDTQVPPMVKSAFMSRDLDQLVIESQQRIDTSENEFELLCSMESLHPCSENIEHNSNFTWSSSPSCGNSHLDTRVRHAQESGIMDFNYSKQNWFGRRDPLERVGTSNLISHAQNLGVFSFYRFHSFSLRKRTPRPRFLFIKSHLPLFCSALTSSSSSPRMGSLCALDEHLQYPIARRDESVVEDFHGVKIADPYRWLEDPDAEEVKEFVQKQVKLTDSVLQICDTREKLREKITKLFDHPRYHAPFRRANKYFYFHNTGLQPQDVLYVQDSLEGEPVVLLDPNALSEDGTVSLNTLSVSEDAKYLAYGLSSSGSDWVTVKVMCIEDKSVEPDILSWVKFSSISWTHDSKGFFYSRYPAPKDGEVVDAGTETNANLYHELYYHFLGTDQSEDILCWRDPENPKYMFGASVTDDGKYVLLYIDEGCDPVNKLYYCDMTALPNGLENFRNENALLPFVKLIDKFDAQYQAIANDDSVFTFLTNKDASKYKLVRVDLKEPTSWTDVLPESEKDVLESACAVNGNQMIVSYLSDVKYVLQLRDLKTGSLHHQLPIDIGTVFGISARREDSMVFIGFTSFLTPGIIYQCNLENEVPDMKIFREIIVPGFDRFEFHANQVFVPSRDGTKIPIFIVARKNIVLDGSHPCLLYGYGGFNISLTASFSVSRVVLTRHLGAVFCIANIRGGGEYGEEWHKAGSLAKKQNCFDDFISAAEYLVSAGYTQPNKLCIEGGSNGGLLVGACINQRPDLFGCALAHVGVMDMLRFHKFTIGHAWTSDYGCSDKEEEFHWLIKYSPLHNVRRPWEEHPDKSIQYPSTMLLTADHDDRVVPLHSLKLLATMQYVLCTSLEKSPQTNPIIGRIECKAGHGAGRPTQKKIEEAADRYAFMAKMLDAPWTE